MMEGVVVVVLVVVGGGGSDGYAKVVARGREEASKPKRPKERKKCYANAM
jgi:hypothetical protein